MLRSVSILLVVAAVLAVAGFATAAKPPLNLTSTAWTGETFAKIKVQKLGKDSGESSFDAGFGAPNLWASFAAGLDLAGAYKMKGSSGFILVYDPPSREAHRNNLEEWVQFWVDREGLGFTAHVEITSIAAQGKVKAKRGELLGLKFKQKTTFIVTGGGYEVKGKFQQKAYAVPDVK